jgi:hypothetical protein
VTGVACTAAFDQLGFRLKGSAGRKTRSTNRMIKKDLSQQAPKILFVQQIAIISFVFNTSRSEDSQES